MYALIADGPGCVDSHTNTSSVFVALCSTVRDAKITALHHYASDDICWQDHEERFGHPVSVGTTEDGEIVYSIWPTIR